MKVEMVTVLLCTYNRAPLLSETLQAILNIRVGDFGVEVIVVDNNSSDRTREVVEDAARHAPFPVVYAFERRQGKSFALNRGLHLARGEVIAHTDDDVWPVEDWLVRCVEAFRTRDITFAFGKVLPRWAAAPPPELLTRQAHEIWGPLALVDYGDEPVDYSPGVPGQRLPIGANLAFRRDTLLTVGGWRTDLGKIDNTLISGEDHEIFVRLKRLGHYEGLYDPLMAVRHHVSASRLTRTYFRRWFYWHGKTIARMPGEVYDLDFAKVPHVFGVPRFIYRQFAEQCWRWARHAGRRDGLRLLIEELQAIQYMGFVVQCWQWWPGRAKPAPAPLATAGVDTTPPAAGTGNRA